MKNPLALAIIIILFASSERGSAGKLPSCCYEPWIFPQDSFKYHGGRFTQNEAHSAISAAIASWTQASPSPLSIPNNISDNLIQWAYYPNWLGSQNGVAYTASDTTSFGQIYHYNIFFRGHYADGSDIPWDVKYCYDQFIDVQSVATHEVGHLVIGPGHFGSGIMEHDIGYNDIRRQLFEDDLEMLWFRNGFCDEIALYSFDFSFDPLQVSFNVQISYALQRALQDMRIDWNVDGASAGSRYLSASEFIDVKDGIGVITLALSSCPRYSRLNVGITPKVACESGSGGYYQKTTCWHNCPCQTALGCEITSIIARPNVAGGTTIEWDATNYDPGVQFYLYRSIDGGISYSDLLATFTNPAGGGTFHFAYNDNMALYNYRYSYRIIDTETQKLWGPVYSYPGGTSSNPPLPGNSDLDINMEYIASGRIKVAIANGQQWAQKYELHYNRDTNGPPYSNIINDNSNKPYFIVDGLADGSDYYFNIVACNLSGCGSMDSTNTIVGTPISVPQDFSAVPYYAGIQLNWDLSEGAAGYLLQYMCILPPGEGIEQDMGNCNQYSIENLQNDSQYQIFMRAYESHGNMTACTDTLIVRTPSAINDIECLMTPERINAATCLLGDVSWHPADQPDSIWAAFIAKDVFGNPVRKFPADRMKMVLHHGNAHSCEGDTIVAQHATDMEGKGYISVNRIAGADSTLHVKMFVDGIEASDSVMFYIRSSNLNGDNVINLQDFVLFSLSYQKSRGQPGYSEHCDYNLDGTVNLSDFCFFGPHFHDGMGCE